MKNLKDKIVFITGSAQGLGYSMAEKFAAEGSHIVLADIKAEKVVESAKAIADKYGVETMPVQLDVSSVPAITEAFAKVKERFGRLDVLVNCAGIQIRCPSKEFPEEKYDKVLGINLKGTFFCCQQAGVLMGEKGGAIVNISSGNSVRPTPGRAPYAISKAGVNALTKVLAAEWGEDVNGKHAIRVNAIAPGFFATAQNHALLFNEDGSLTPRSDKIISHTPMGRFGVPEDLDGTLLWLLDKTKTNMGARKLQSWLLSPLFDKEKI